MSVKWRGEELILLISEGLKFSLDEIAFGALERAQHNIESNDQVDTGAMYNSAYVSSETTDSYKGGEKHEPKRQAGENEAIAGFSVEYALAQEVRKPFLYPALESVAADVPGIMKAKIKL